MSAASLNKFAKKAKRIVLCQGDVAMEDNFFSNFDNFAFSTMKNQALLQQKMETNVMEENLKIIENSENTEKNFEKSMRKTLKTIKNDLKMVKERETTPVTNKKRALDDVAPLNINNNAAVSLSRQNSKEKENKEVIQRKATNKRQLPINTDEKSIIKLEKNCNIYLTLVMTDDPDLKLLVDLINEETDGNWKSGYISENCKIFKKSIENNPCIMLKTYATIDGFTKDDIFKAMTTISIRKQWDKVFDQFKIMEKDPETGAEFLYMSIKVN